MTLLNWYFQGYNINTVNAYDLQWVQKQILLLKFQILISSFQTYRNMLELYLYLIVTDVSSPGMDSG